MSKQITDQYPLSNHHAKVHQSFKSCESRKSVLVGRTCNERLVLPSCELKTCALAQWVASPSTSLALPQVDSQVRHQVNGTLRRCTQRRTLEVVAATPSDGRRPAGAEAKNSKKQEARSKKQRGPS